MCVCQYINCNVNMVCTINCASTLCVIMGTERESGVKCSSCAEVYRVLSNFKTLVQMCTHIVRFRALSISVSGPNRFCRRVRAENIKAPRAHSNLRREMKSMPCAEPAFGLVVDNWSATNYNACTRAARLRKKVMMSLLLVETLTVLLCRKEAG